MTTSLLARCALVLAATAFCAGAARAESDFFSKPLQVYMPGAPGGSYDVMTRLVMARLSERLKQPILVNNIAGAGGTVAVERGMKSDPNESSLIIGYVGNLAVAPWIYPKLSYDPVKDLKPVALLGGVSYVLAVPAASPYKTVDELLRAARANPGKLTFASAGNGTGGHIGGELIKSIARVDMLHVPYQGAAPASIALLGGQVDWAIEALPTSLANVKGGRLRALAVTSAAPQPQLPNVPTMADAGFPGFELQSWLGVMVPLRTPEAVVQKLNAEINAVLQSAELRAAYANLGADTLGGTAAHFGEYIRTEVEKYGRVIKSSNAKSD